MENLKENKVEQVVESALKKIKDYGANQVIGTPIVNDKGHTVIPMSNVTVAVFSGGGEYGDVKIDKLVGFEVDDMGGCRLALGVDGDYQSVDGAGEPFVFLRNGLN